MFLSALSLYFLHALGFHAPSPLFMAGAIPATAPAPEPPPAVPAQDVRFAWGGETRQVFSRDVMNGPQLEHHTWTVGDGCIIRHRVTIDGIDGPWEIQGVPADVSQSLLDIYFLADGQRGWACGSAGLFLQTTDGGATWEADRICVPVCQDEDTYPTFWRVRFASEEEGYLCGLWTFMRTTDGGDNWSNVTLMEDLTVKKVDRFEFYALEIIEAPEGWIGVCAGEEWPWEGHCPPPVPLSSRGVIFYTNSTSDEGGQVWEERFSAEEYNQGSPPVVVDLDDPWDFAFEPNPLSLEMAVGYLAGGSGTTCGTILRTEDSGYTWSFEWGGGGCTGSGQTGPYTLYAVAALSGGRAVACGYGGQVWYRRIKPGTLDQIQWKKVQVDPPAGSSMGKFSGPLAGAERADSENGDCTVVGTWGMIASAFIPAINDPSTFVWEPQNPNGSQGKEQMYRFNDVYFRGEMVEGEWFGLAVGQHQGIAESSDGGETWNSLYGGPGSTLHGTPKLEGIAFKPDGITGVAVGTSFEEPCDFVPWGCETGPGVAYTLHFDGNSWNTPVKVCLPGAWNLDGVDHAALDYFWAAGWKLDGQGNLRPLLVYSDDDGACGTWQSVGLGALPNGLYLKDVAFVDIGNGFAVGYIQGALGTTQADVPRAYRITYDPVLDVATVTDVTPYSLLPPDARFHDVDTRGASLASGEIYIAGGPNLLLVWDNTLGAFVNASGIPACPENCDSMSNPTACSLDFRSVSLSPSGSLILVGLEGVPHEHVSHELGRMLRKLGPSSPWEWIPGRSIKDCLATYLVSDTQGWVIAGPDNRGSVLSEEEEDYWVRLDNDPEWGSGADSAILIYDPQE